MNINNINVNKYPISQILDPESKTIYEIPKYQREYIWGTKQWEELFNDLMENGAGYFLGSIICINTTQDTLNNPKFEVVDGQQRLTTLSLLLAALYVTLDSNRDSLDEDQQSDILQLKRKLVIKKTRSEIRIVPQVQHKNLEDYMGLLADKKIIAPHQTPKFAGNRRIFQGYNYFKRRIDSELEASNNKVATMFEILEKVNTAILVMIEVSNHSDAYTLFESLNDRGTPLTSLDLIKNLLLARFDITDSDNLDYYFDRWIQIMDALGDDDSARESLSSATSTTIRVAPLLSCACGSALSPTKLSVRDCGNSKTAANTTTSTSPPKRGANPTGSWASTAHRRYPSPPDTARIPWGGCRHQRWLWYVNATGRTAALRPKHSGCSISQRTVATAKS